MSPEAPAPEDAEQAKRRRFVDDAVHSLGMEGLTVEPEVLSDADDYVRGTITIDAFLARINARYRLG